jgi:hypothetical protein
MLFRFDNFLNINTHLLVHERMLESYALARERFLKPGGLMFPTTGSIVLGPLTDEVLYNEQLSTYNKVLLCMAHASRIVSCNFNSCTDFDIKF